MHAVSERRHLLRVVDRARQRSRKPPNWFDSLFGAAPRRRPQRRGGSNRHPERSAPSRRSSTSSNPARRHSLLSRIRLRDAPLVSTSAVRTRHLATHSLFRRRDAATDIDERSGSRAVDVGCLPDLGGARGRHHPIGRYLDRPDRRGRAAEELENSAPRHRSRSRSDSRASQRPPISQRLPGPRDRRRRTPAGPPPPPARTTISSARPCTAASRTQRCVRTGGRRGDRKQPRRTPRSADDLAPRVGRIPRDLR